jgi:F420-dependent oxidoreductase-like protein
VKLGLIVGGRGGTFTPNMELILAAERLGFDSVWTSESWGHDAVTPAAWILARTSKIKVGTGIIQMSTRVPTITAMTAITLQQMSGGRFILGLGPSGPQVVEGWHGVPYGRPLTRLREYVSIVRQVLAREGPVTHEGYHYQLPLTGEGTTGLGKPLKSILHGDPNLQIVSAAISPAGVKVAAEICDGFIPIFMDPARFDVFEEDIKAGFAKASSPKSMNEFAVMPYCTIVMDDDMEKARTPVRENVGLYVGGMGSKDKNFYNDFVSRIGFADAAAEVQDHFLSGRRAEAVQAVPDELIDRVSLTGPRGRIVELLGEWKEAGSKRHVDTLIVRATRVEELRVLAETLL